MVGIRGEAANPTICYVLSAYWLLNINSGYTGARNFWEKVRIFEFPALSQYVVRKRFLGKSEDFGLSLQKEEFFWEK